MFARQVFVSCECSRLVAIKGALFQCLQGTHLVGTNPNKGDINKDDTFSRVCKVGAWWAQGSGPPSERQPALRGRSSVVRELHVYGTAVAVHARDAGKHQHQVTPHPGAAMPGCARPKLLHRLRSYSISFC